MRHLLLVLMTVLAGTLTCAGVTALADPQRVRVADNAESQNGSKATAAPAGTAASIRVNEPIEGASDV